MGHVAGLGAKAKIRRLFVLFTSEKGTYGNPHCSGLAAALFTTISLFPQVLKSWRTLEATKDNTVAMFSMLFCVGDFFCGWFTAYPYVTYR
jgi:hypothetical protein